MKAIVWTKYGPPDVLQLQEVKKPAPKADEVLIKIHATTVTLGDCEMRSLSLPFMFRVPIRLYVGLRRPTRTTILGQELAGEIEAVGQTVKRFKPGDQVFAATGFSMGAYAEYICLAENSGEALVAIKPANMCYDEAATVPFGGLDALHFIRACNIQAGQSILINGAGGSIGTFAVQLAKHFGAEVTAVDSADKLAMLRSLGADHVIDYQKEDFTQKTKTYNAIFDVVGKANYSSSLESLEQNGTYVTANPGALDIIRGSLTSRTSDKTVISQVASKTPEDALFMKELIEAGVIRTVIDRRYPLEQTAEAHRYVETGQKAGHVVIMVLPQDEA